MENFNIRAGLWLIGMALIAACVKDPQDIPSGMSQDPVFGIKGQFGNGPVDIDAGVNTWTFIPVVRKADSINIYSAVLSQDGCINQCGPSWTFNFYQALPNAGSEEENFTHTIQTGPVEFALADVERDSFKVTISTHPDLFMNGYSFWEDLNNPVTAFTNEFSSTLGYNQEFDVCFQSAEYAGCQYSQCVYFKPATLTPCLVHLEARLENARILVLTARPEGTPPFQFEWSNGETSANTIVQLKDSIADIYAVVTVTDATGNRSELNQTVKVQNGQVDACYFPINLQSQSFSNAAVFLAAGDLEIIYTDENGVAWRSTRGIQPADVHAEINHTEYYGLSPYSQPAFKITMSLRVLLTNNETGESKYFETSQCVLPLSHP